MTNFIAVPDMEELSLPLFYIKTQQIIIFANIYQPQNIVSHDYIWIIHYTRDLTKPLHLGTELI